MTLSTYRLQRCRGLSEGVIFFDWDLDGSADHVGIVVGTDGSRVYTVEGNSGDACKIKSYSLTYECIKGYGLMNW